MKTLCTLLLSAVAAVAAGQPPPDVAPAQAPVFRVGTELVQLVVRVTDRDGRPVAGLAEADFTILQDGKRQPIRLFRYVPGASSRQAAFGTATVAPDMPPVIVLVDDGHMMPPNLAWVREAARQAVRGLPATAAMAAVLSTRPGAHSVALTGDRDELLGQLDALAPTTAWYGAFPDPALRSDCATDLSANLAETPFGAGTLAALPEVLAALGRIPGTKRLLLVAESVVAPDCRETLWTFHERLRRLSDLATRSGVVIDALHALPRSSGATMPERRAAPATVAGPQPFNVPPDNTVSDALSRLAEGTGGEAWRSNDPASLVRRVMTVDDGHYLVGYEPPPGTFDIARRPRYRELAVRVHRKGVTVRARSGFYSVTDEQLRVLAR